MRVQPFKIVSSLALAAALALISQQSAVAGITKTVDNSAAPSPWFPWLWQWHHKPKPPAPGRNKYCPPYFVETHGYTVPQWRPWPKEELKTTGAKGAETSPQKSDATPKGASTPTTLPDSVGGKIP